MKPRVAMIAYACDPEGTGEHWLGWGWAEQAAHDFDIHLFAPPKSRGAIERHAVRVGLTPHFVELPAGLRRLSERLGGTGGWWRKFAWQKRAAREVSAWHAQERFALVHQTTFHTFRVPFAAASLGIPAVWGPIAGGEHTPPGFDDWLGAAQAAERWRTFGNQLCRAAPAVRRSLRDADAIFVSNRVTLDFLPSFCRAKCQIVPPNALRNDMALDPRPNSGSGDTLRLIYAGNCVATRSIPLVLAAMARSGDTRTTLTVAGQGPALEDWRRDTARLGLQDRVRFMGQVDRATLEALYAAADVLVFPALRDAGGSALLEAMSKGMPVICFDWGGPAEMVDESTGVKIAVRDPEQTIRDLAAALERWRADPEARALMGARAAESVQRCFTWERKRALLGTVYRRLISGS